MTRGTDRSGAPYEIGDVLGAADFGSFALSPDGRLLAISRLEYVPALAMRRSRVTVLALDEGLPSRLPPETVVFTGDCDGWSPEIADGGERILFLSDYTGEARPFIAASRDAVPELVPCVTRMAVAPKWRPSPAVDEAAPRGFAFLSFATRAEQGFADPIVWEKTPEAGYRHLYVVDDPAAAVDAPGATRKVTAGPEDVYDYDWSPDGARLFALASPAFEMERHLDAELRVLDPEDGAVLARHAMPRGLSAFVSSSPAGTHVAFVVQGANARAGKPDLYTLRLADGHVQRVSESVPGWVSRYDWTPGGAGLLFPAAEGVGAALYHAALRDDGTFGPPRAIYRPDSRPDGFIAGLSVARRAPRAVLRLEGPRMAPLLVQLALDDLLAPREGARSRLSRARPITTRSPRKEARLPGTAEPLSLRAHDGHPLDAVLLHAAPTAAPTENAPERRPVVIWLHGGPNEFCALSFQPWWQLCVARGYVVLAPNFRGSGSYDEARVRTNVGDLGGGDALDVIACLDAIAARDDVDATRVVLFGWSYGAHLAFHVARRLGERASCIKRIVAGGGVYDWLSHYGQAELRFPFRDYLGGSPLADATEADRRSPIRFARELGERLSGCAVHLVAGQNDGRASPMQSRMMHRALREAGVDSTHLLYPAEAHVLVEPEHVRDLLDRVTMPVPA